MGVRGIQPKTTLCRGPALSKDRGLDTMCCARCNVLRQQLCRMPRSDVLYSAEIGSFIYNDLALEYLSLLESRGIIRENIYTCCAVSMCDDAPIVFVPPGKTKLVDDNVHEIVKQQMMLWKEMGLVGRITCANVGYTHGGMPVILPGNETVRMVANNTEGIVVEGDYIRVLDMEKALNSSYAHVVGYWCVMRMLFSLGGTERERRESSRLRIF